MSDLGPIIVESHTRTGGDQIFEMVELACGVDMFGATLQGFAGNFPKIEIEKHGSAAIRYLILPMGKVISVEGVELAKDMAGIVRCDLSLKVGDETKCVQYSDERSGYILAAGTSEKNARDIVNRALTMVDIKVDCAASK